MHNNPSYYVIRRGGILLSHSMDSMAIRTPTVHQEQALFPADIPFHRASPASVDPFETQGLELHEEHL